VDLLKINKGQRYTQTDENHLVMAKRKPNVLNHLVAVNVPTHTTTVNYWLNRILVRYFESFSNVLCLPGNWNMLQ